MSDSWRIDVILNDQSAVTQASIGSVGATVIKATKGSAVPTFFAPGQEKRIRDMFGTPSPTYPEVWEAIQYNASFPLWISAPSSNSRHGGVVVRPGGTETFTGGLPGAESLTFSALPQIEQAGVGDGSTGNFTFTIGNFSDYVALSTDILLAGVSENVVAVDGGAGTETLTGDNGSGTYTAATGVVDYTFSTAPSTSEVVEVRYNLDFSDAYFVLFSKSPSTNELAALVTHNGTNFVVAASRKDSAGNYTSLAGYPKTVSIVEGTKDGFGSNIFVDDLFSNTDFIGGKANPSVTFTSFSDDSALVDFEGGTRGTMSGTDLVTGWAYFQQKRKYPADVMFDASADVLIPDVFDTMRNSYQKFSHYILPLPNEDSTPALGTKIGYSISNRGISFYWNWGRVQNQYTGGSFWTTLAGRVAVKHAQMFDTYNGLQPAWIDENGHGGQIGGGILEIAYDPSETALEALDQGAINPIIFDPQNGVLLASAKTSLTSLTDYSYIGHSRLGDYLIKNIQEQALPAQLTKLNDQDHRKRVSLKADSIVRPVFAAGLLREYGVVCDETNNTDEVLQRREFVLDVAVKFTPFSETIRFVFTNLDQTTTVQEFFGA